MPRQRRLSLGRAWRAVAAQRCAALAVCLVLSAGAGSAAPATAGESDGPSPPPNTILPAAPPVATATPVAVTSDPGTGGIQILAVGFGQSRPGGPVTVAARIQNDGPSVDLIPISITIYDAGGVVIGAGDVTAHYLVAGETTGFAHRLTTHGSGAAAQVQLQPGDGRPASDPLPGSLEFSSVSLVTDRSGMEVSAVLTSTYSNDLSEVRVDAIAYDGRGSIIGGGELIKRRVPAGSSVGVLVPLDLSGTPARIELYAHLP